MGPTQQNTNHKAHQDSPTKQPQPPVKHKRKQRHRKTNRNRLLEPTRRTFERRSKRRRRRRRRRTCTRTQHKRTTAIRGVGLRRNGTRSRRLAHDQPVKMPSTSFLLTRNSNTMMVAAHERRTAKAPQPDIAPDHEVRDHDHPYDRVPPWRSGCEPGP